jgi:hypothetical protein
MLTVSYLQESLYEGPNNIFINEISTCGPKVNRLTPPSLLPYRSIHAHVITSKCNEINAHFGFEAYLFQNAAIVPSQELNNCSIAKFLGAVSARSWKSISNGIWTSSSIINAYFEFPYLNQMNNSRLD